MKKKLLELLEKDKEFKYAVIGYLGLDRIERTQTAILEEAKKLWEEVKALRESQERLWEEIKALREGQDKLWEENRRLWEEVRALREDQGKLWEEVKALREGQERLWEEVKALREDQRRLWEEIKALREGQEKLWEENRRLWEEVRALREGQERLWEEIKALREGQGKLWEEVRALREGQERLWEENKRIWEEIKALREGQGKLWDEVGRVWRYVKSGFEGIREALGVSFEEYVASFIRFMLYELGYPEAKVEVRKHIIHEGRLIELNIFSEEPLIVGEATLTIKSIEEAEEEIRKLNERANIANKLYGKKPLLTILAIGNAPEETIDHLKKLTSKHGIKLIIGRELKEIF